MWVIAIIVFLLIWGNLSRKSPNHPLNKVRINPKMPLCSTSPTAGDNFNSGCTFVAGVCQPDLGCDANRRVPIFPPHITFPVDAPPPIAIQVPKTPPLSHPVTYCGPTPVSAPAATTPTQPARTLLPAAGGGLIPEGGQSPSPISPGISCTPNDPNLLLRRLVY